MMADPHFIHPPPDTLAGQRSRLLLLISEMRGRTGDDPLAWVTMPVYLLCAWILELENAAAILGDLQSRMVNSEWEKPR